MRSNSFNVFSLLKYRKLLAASVRTELKEKHAGLALGSLWLVLQPLFLLVIYSVVYAFIFKLRPAHLSSIDYLLQIFSGLVPFMAISEALNSGSSSIRANKSLLKNTVFPIELIPLRSVLASQVNFLFALALVLCFSTYSNHLSSALVLLPYLIILQAMFLTGIAWVLGLVSLVLKDMQHLIAYIVMVLMISSPIAYSLDMLPSNLRFFFWLNPVAQFIVCYQKIILYEEFPSAEILASISAISIVTFIVGFGIFKKMKPVIINYV